jgi:HK97 family phage prohead protease
VVIKTNGGVVAAENRVALLDFFKGVTNSKGELKESVELFAPVIMAAGLPSEVQKGNYAIPWTFSTFDVDRFGERVDPEGWDVSCYMKNPVVQWAHCSDIPAIGFTEKLTSDASGLHGEIVFNPKDIDAFGWSIGERVRAGVLRAGSVGFRVIEIELPKGGSFDDGASLIFRKQELLEFSICNVPANPFALSRGFAQQENKSSVNIPNSFWGNIITL